MLVISNNVSIPLSEIEFSAIRAQGPGGQNVNKVSSAVHIRFEVKESSLSEFYKSRLLKFKDSRIGQDGCIIIKAQKFRSLDKNKEDGLNRLVELIRKSAVIQKKRRPTKPSRSSQNKRLDSKTKQGRIKSMRGKVNDD